MLKEKLVSKNIIEVLINIAITIVVLISFILVGSPIKDNMIIVNEFIIVLGIIFGVYKLIKKETILIGKIDVIVLLFFVSPIIPILFNSYDNLEDTLFLLLRNISLFNIYILIKGHMLKLEKGQEKVTNILLIGLTILTFLGFDELLDKTLFRYMRYLGIPNIINYEGRMFSTLGYANSFAILMGIGIFLCFNKINNNNKLQFSSLLYVFVMALLLTYSRSVLIIFILVFGVYIIFSKERIYSVILLAINLILALIGMKIFNLFLQSEYYLFSWLSIIGLSGIVWIISKELINYKTILAKVKIKTCIYIVLVIVGVVIVGYIIGLQLVTPLRLFIKGQNSDFVRYKLYDIENKEEYIFDFDILAKTLGGKDNIYTIEITEENKYYDTIATHAISFGEFEGNKQIKFKTKEETIAIVIFFKSNSETLQNGLTINKLKINGDKKALNYVYLPLPLVERIESFNLRNKSIWERLVYFKDALKIIEKKPLTGNGANGWRYNYEAVQNYVYSASESHSYILGIVIDSGLLAGILFVAIIVYVIYKIVKRKKVSEIDMAFMLLNIHSMVDFNMSFYVISLIWISLLATLVTDGNNENKSGKLIKNINTIISMCFIILNISFLVLGGLAYKVEEENNYIIECSRQYIKEKRYDEALNNIKILENDMKYNIYVYEIIQNIDYSKITNENLDYIYATLTRIPLIANSGYNIMKNRILLRVSQTTHYLDYSRKFANRIVETNESVIKNIENKEANRLEDKIIQMLLVEQEMIYQNAKKILEI